MEKINADFIIKTLVERIEDSKANFDAQTWIDAAMKLSVLLLDEEEDEIRKSFAFNKVKLQILEGQDKRNVSEAELRASVTEEWLAMRLQEAKVKNITEMIRVAKKKSDRDAGQ